MLTPDIQSQERHSLLLISFPSG